MAKWGLSVTKVITNDCLFQNKFTHGRLDRVL